MAKTRKGSVAGNNEDAPAGPVAESGVFFVDRGKHSRAKVILDLVSGKRTPKDQNEIERLAHYQTLLSDAGVNPKDASALQFIYEKLLGGLVRNDEEQEAADERATEMRAKNKRRPIEG